MSDSNALLQRRLKLDRLGQQLLKNAELISSGRLQVLSLAKVKRRAGKDWCGLSAVVFNVVERVLLERFAPPNLFLRYKDDTYLLLFGPSTGVDFGKTVAELADAIHDQLFQDTEPAISRIVGSERIVAVKTADFSAREGLGYVQSKEESAILQVPKTEVPTNIQAIDIEERTHDEFFNDAYHPIWEINKDAVTAYVCFPCNGHKSLNPMTAYEQFFSGKSYSEKVERDLRVLDRVRFDLLYLHREGKQTMIVCPIHYDTLYRDEGFQQFIHKCALIPEPLRKYLILMIVDVPKTLPVKSAFWFVANLRRKLCRAIYLDATSEHTLLSENIWGGSGIDGLGFVIDENESEEVTMQKLDRFTLVGQGHNLRTAVLNAQTFSAVSMALGCGADFICGSVVAASASQPDAVFRFKYESIYLGAIS